MCVHCKMEPSSYPNGPKMTNADEIFQNWHKNGECPKGTIPIRRSNSTFHYKHRLFSNITQKLDEYEQHEVYIYIYTYNTFPTRFINLLTISR